MLSNFVNAIDKIKTIDSSEYGNFFMAFVGVCGTVSLTFSPYTGNEDFTLALGIFPIFEY